MTSRPKTLIIGGTSAIAAALIDTLSPVHDLTVLTGREWTPPAGVRHGLVELTAYDGSHTLHWRERYDAVLCIAPIVHMPRFLPHLSDSKGARAVFLSSNNAALLSGNADYEGLRAAEDAVLASALDAVILQPTAICGRPGDPVLGHIAERVGGGRTVWLPGARTRQWPIDYRDVARAMIHATAPVVASGCYSLSGPQGLSYADMVRTLETALWRPARLRDVPAAAGRAVGGVMARIAPHGPDGAALRRAGIDRAPVNASLPGFRSRFGLGDMLQGATATEPHA